MDNGKVINSGLSKSLFWDVDIEHIHIEKHASFIMNRVLSMGTMDDFKIAKSIYGNKKLKEIVKNLRYMNARELYFCSTYFNIPVTEFRCYTTMQSIPTYWNY